MLLAVVDQAPATLPINKIPQSHFFVQINKAMIIKYARLRSATHYYLIIIQLQFNGVFIINFKETASYYEKHLPVMHCHMHRCFFL